MAGKVSPSKLIIRRITSLRAIKNNDGDVIGYKATCNHNNPPETKVYPLTQWGEIAYQLAKEWTLDHKCRGDHDVTESIARMANVANAIGKR